MRITFVLPEPWLSGGIKIVVNYAEAMQRRGHDVRIVVRPNYDPILFRRKVKSFVLGRGWPADPSVEPSFLDSAKVPVHITRMRRPIDDRDVPDADVVVATWWETAEWVARLSPSKGAKAYLIQQYEANFDQPIDRVDATWRLPLHKITISQWLVDMARDRFGDRANDADHERDQPRAIQCPTPGEATAANRRPDLCHPVAEGVSDRPRGARSRLADACRTCTSSASARSN